MSVPSSNPFGWEMVKENSQPISRGRQVSVLNSQASIQLASSKTAGKKGLSVQRETMSIIDSQRERFESLIKPSEELLTNPSPKEQQLDELSDPLAHWIAYIKWTEEQFPSGNNKVSNLLPLLERCTRLFMKVYTEKYRNDKRYLRCWIKYADMLEDSPGELFQYLYTNRVGEDLALFYIAWAFVAEKASNYSLADDIYQRGLNRGAKPLDQLKQRFRQFQRRMSRKWLKSQPGSPSGSRGSSSPHKSFNTGKNSQKSRIHQGSRMRVGDISHATKAAIRKSKNMKKKSRGFGSLTNNASNFQIFDDFSEQPKSKSKDFAIHSDFQSGSSVQWEHYPTEHQRKKENLRETKKWTEDGGLRGIANVQVDKPAFQIFSDPSGDSSGSGHASFHGDSSGSRTAFRGDSSGSGYKSKTASVVKNKKKKKKKKKKKRREILCKAVQEEKERGGERRSLEELRAIAYMEKREVEAGFTMFEDVSVIERDHDFSMMTKEHDIQEEEEGEKENTPPGGIAALHNDTSELSLTRAKEGDVFKDITQTHLSPTRILTFDLSFDMTSKCEIKN